MQIVINLDRSSADLISEFSAGAKIYLYSAATEGGAYSLVGSGTLLVSGTERYEVYDTAGTPGTTWYKFRVGNTGGTLFTEYSASWLSTSLTAYASLDDLREVLLLGTDTSRDNMLTDLLVDVSAEVDERCSRRFYRYPQVSGTTTLYWDVVRSCASLKDATDERPSTTGIPLDIISITTLQVRDDEQSDYVTLTVDTDYWLEHGVGQGDWPSEDITLASLGLYAGWPTGKRAVKIVGAFGFSAVPSVVKRAVITEVAERFRQSISGGSQPEGVNQFGTPMFLTGASPAMRRLTHAPYAKNWAYV